MNDKETPEEFAKRGGKVEKVPIGKTNDKPHDWKTQGGDWLRGKDRGTPAYWIKRNKR